MTFLKGLFKKLKNPDDGKRKSSLDGIERGVDPFEKWDILSELGDGAFGKVFKTRRKSDDVQAALKKVEFESELELEDFMVEIDILTDFKHHNILSLLEVYIYDNKLWMFLELCGGGALDSIMNSLDKPLTEFQIRFVSREVLSGLDFLHKNLIIHRDMKAGNILLTSSYEVKLADFGVSARLTNEKQKRDTFIGTPYWMAPEVVMCEALKESPYNWKADIWSLGITLIELAQMRPPYNEINPTRVLLKITKSEPPTLSKPKLWSTEFSQILSRCLQKDPNKRPECRELLLDPFVQNVTEEDRKYIRLLLCELKADVVDIVEELDPAQVPEEEQPEESVLVLPDSTKIEIPLEIMDEEDEGLEVDIGSKEATHGDATELDSTTLASNPQLLSQVTKELTDQLIEEVITSETRHPSVPSCLFEVMRDLSDALDAVPQTDESSHAPNVAQPESLPPADTPLRRQRSVYRTLTRTRRFVVDGKEITTTSTRVIHASAEERRLRDDELNKRKAELRAFRILGKREALQTREITARAAQLKEQLENKLSSEFLALKRSYEQKLEVVARNYRAQLERLEKEFEADAKRIRIDCVKEQQSFKDQLRSELENYSRAERKAVKRELQADHSSTLAFPSWSAPNSSLISLRSATSNSGSAISQRLSVFKEKQDTRLNDQICQLTTNFNARLNALRQEELVEKQALRMSEPQPFLLFFTLFLLHLDWIYAQKKNEDEKDRDKRLNGIGSGRVIPLKQGFLYKRTCKPLNKEWKTKKYVTLTDDARLTYHPSIHDYMDNTHGKEIDLSRTTVKIPGVPFRQVGGRITSNGLLRSNLIEISSDRSNAGGNRTGSPDLITAFADTTASGTTDPVASVKKRHRRVKSNPKGTNADGYDSEGYEFQLISMDRQWHFEAKGPEERDEWVAHIERAIMTRLQLNESNKRTRACASCVGTTCPVTSICGSAPNVAGARSLGDSSSLTSGISCTDVIETTAIEHLLPCIRAVAGNERCADCGSADPDWASLNLGALVCISCSGIHRQLGTHISRIRSLHLDEWSPESVAVMCAIGNTLANSVWEAAVPVNAGNRKKPDASSSREEKEVWIRAKYDRQEFLPPLPYPDAPLQQQLIDAIARQDTRQVVLCLALATPDTVNAAYSRQDPRAAIHIAATLGNLVYLQLLLWYNGDPAVTDHEGRNAYYYAHCSQKYDCAEFLRRNGCPKQLLPPSSSGLNSAVMERSAQPPSLSQQPVCSGGPYLSNLPNTGISSSTISRPYHFSHLQQQPAHVAAPVSCVLTGPPSQLFANQHHPFIASKLSHSATAASQPYTQGMLFAFLSCAFFHFTFAGALQLCCIIR
ncbi:unnamed protein product [Dicrocoelium dendriticum]|nr:unnamed protein product [Dicrocoelium dendriticum]